eukprot:s1256_g3.t1
MGGHIIVCALPFLGMGSHATCGPLGLFVFEPLNPTHDGVCAGEAPIAPLTYVFLSFGMSLIGYKASAGLRPSLSQLRSGLAVTYCDDACSLAAHQTCFGCDEKIQKGPAAIRHPMR